MNKEKKIQSNSKLNPIETYIEKTVEKVIKAKENNIKKEDAEEIIKAIIPEIERIVSKIILKHIKAFATYSQQKFKDPKEI